MVATTRGHGISGRPGAISAEVIAPPRPLIARVYTLRAMDPHTAAAVILALCLLLIVVTYVLGVEVGKTLTLLTHPGYGAALQAA